MTEFNNINKFILNTPKTYEVRYLENKEPSTLSKIDSYLGIKTVGCMPKSDGNGGGAGGGGGAHTVHVESRAQATRHETAQRQALKAEIAGEVGCIIL